MSSDRQGMSAVCDGGFAAIANFVEDFVAMLWNDVHIAVWLETIWQAFVPICLTIPSVAAIHHSLHVHARVAC